MDKNFLTPTQKFALANWLNNNIEHAHARTMSTAEIAEDAEKMLGFTVTNSNLQYAAKMTGHELPRSGAGGHVPNNGTLGMQIRELDSRLTALEQSLGVTGEPTFKLIEGS